MSQENVELFRRIVAAAVCVGALMALVAPAQAAFPGRNGRIAYFDSDGGISSVWANGVGRQRLVPDHGGAPVYSPRGDRLVFSRFYVLRAEPNPIVTQFELSRVELVRADGRGRIVLTTGADDYSPAWAPDGKRIVFGRSNPCDKYYNAEADCPPRVQQDKKYGILIRRRDGGTRVVTRNGWGPAWSPTGKLIVYFHLARTGRVDLFLMRPDGSRQHLLRENVGFAGIDWSPDGTRLVFGYGTRNGSDIAKIRRDGTGFRRLVQNGAAPAYSPDGRWIVFTRSDERHCGFAEQALWVMRASGGHPRALRYRSGRRICGAGPDWQPLP